MKVLFLTNGPIEHPTSRHRVYQYLDFLKASGIDATVSPGLSPREYSAVFGTARRTIPRAIAVNVLTARHRVFDLARAHDFDIVVIQRNILATFVPVFELALCRHHPAVVFDFDDLIMSPQFAELIPRTGGGLRQRLFRNRMDLVVKAARQIIVGSPFLRERALELNPNVTLIPTPVDLRRYTLRAEPKPSDQVIIGWKGGRSAPVYLHPLQPVFEQLARRYGNRFKAVVHGDPDFRRFGPYMEIRPFDLATEIEELHRFDIGLMPLADDDFTRGKCAFKAIEYMAAGVPSVSSPVGVICDIVQHGVNGFLARSHDEWIEVLSRLIEDVPLRRAVGLAGRRTVEARFSVEATGPKLVQTLRTATGDK
jgi:glycosyltransferase involved in cell wall biosynthesis